MSSRLNIASWAHTEAPSVYLVHILRSAWYVFHSSLVVYLTW